MNKNIDDGGPAFPRSGVYPYISPQNGTSLRDYIAIKAMQGDWAAQSESTGEWTSDIPEENLLKRARLYYRMADAIIKVSKE
jgi:hypothetical protein